MANELHGKKGSVYGNPLLVDNTGSAWTAGAVGDSVSSVAGPGVDQSVNAQRDTTTALGGNALMMYHNISSLDLHLYAVLAYWFRSGVTTALGDMQMILSSANALVTPVESLNTPAFSANVWRLVLAPLANPGSDSAILSVGPKMITNLANSTFDVSNIYALQALTGIKGWTITYDQPLVSVTSFSDGVAGTGERFRPGIQKWSGSFAGLKTGAPLNIGDSVYLALAESQTQSQSWIGEAYITKVATKVNITGAVEYTYDFTGNGQLQIATL